MSEVNFEVFCGCEIREWKHFCLWSRFTHAAQVGVNLLVLHVCSVLQSYFKKSEKLLCNIGSYSDNVLDS